MYTHTHTHTHTAGGRTRNDQSSNSEGVIDGEDGVDSMGDEDDVDSMRGR